MHHKFTATVDARYFETLSDVDKDILLSRFNDNNASVLSKLLAFKKHDSESTETFALESKFILLKEDEFGFIRMRLKRILKVYPSLENEINEVIDLMTGTAKFPFSDMK